MLSESFLDKCYDIITNIPSDYSHIKELCVDISEIINWYAEDITGLEISHNVKTKVDSILTVANRAKDGDVSAICLHSDVDRILKNENYIPKRYAVDEIESYHTIIRQRKQSCTALKHKKKIERLLQDIGGGSHDDKQIVSLWGDVIETAYRDFLTCKREEAISKAETFDIANDDCRPLFHRMIQHTDSEKTLKTGYNYLERILPYRGFEDKRIYLIGGSSGVGKSTKLINLISNASLLNTDVGTDKTTFLYITGENLIDESWVRFFCCLTKIPCHVFTNEMQLVSRKLKQIALDNKDTLDIATQSDELLSTFETKYNDKLKRILEEKNVNIIFKYIRAKSTTISEIYGIVEEIASQNKLRAIFIDYLDLVCSGRNLEYRHELGVVAQEFKNIAVDYNVPLITATQLNREGYNTNNEASLTQVGESIQKVENSDFVLFLQNDKQKLVEYTMGGHSFRSKRIRATVLKNRNGAEFDSFPCMIPLTRDLDEIFAYRIEEVPKHVIDQEAAEERNSESDVRSKDVDQRDYNKQSKQRKPYTPKSKYTGPQQNSKADEYIKIEAYEEAMAIIDSTSESKKDVTPTTSATSDAEGFW